MSTDDHQPLDFAALVALITESVLARLDAPPSAGSRSTPASMAPAPQGRRLGWVLAAPCGHLAPLCGQLAVLARLGHHQRVVACADVADTLRSTPGWPGESTGLTLQVVSGAGQGVSALLAELGETDQLYVGSLGWHQASALVALDDRDGFVQLLLGALAAGKPVSLVAGEALDGLQGLAPGNDRGAAPALAREAQRLWRALEGLGVKGLDLNELRRPLAALEAASSPQGRAFGGLLTERDVEEAAAAGLRELRLTRATLVTPLARDRARALDVRIEQS